MTFINGAQHGGRKQRIFKRFNNLHKLQASVSMVQTSNVTRLTVDLYVKTVFNLLSENLEVRDPHICCNTVKSLEKFVQGEQRGSKIVS